jgi:hypothetical protein
MDDRRFAPSAIEAGDLPAALDPLTTSADAVLRFIEAYRRAWNAKDAQALATAYYQLPADHHLHAEPGIRALLDAAVATGWSESSFDLVSVHAITDGAYLVRIGYTRRTADGRVLPPADRLGAYVVRRFGDGFRITGFPLAGRPLVEARPPRVAYGDADEGYGG